ncbi:MAG: hypothetical protein WA061_03350 [Microgenomates group bacterium]
MKKRIKQLEQYNSELQVVEPNDLGIPVLTVIYRKINIFFKTAPFVFIVPLSLLLASLLVYLFGFVVVKLASLLQYGF